MNEIEKQVPTIWRQWLEHPERIWLRRAGFQIHFWLGAAVSAYVFVMSLSGSVIVFQNEFAERRSMRWLVHLHTNLLAGTTGRLINGTGALSLLMLCLTGATIWWPGVRHWRRSLSFDWRARFPRLNWDAHSALGFWSFGFVLMWALSAASFVYPEPFEAALLWGSSEWFTYTALGWLADLHFGRFNLFTKAAWFIVGLVPAVLGFTGVFICCRRVILGKPSNPNASHV